MRKKNLRFYTKILMAVAVLFAVVVKAEASETVLYEGSDALSWNGTYVNATTITATTGLTLHITIETTADAWWQFKMCQNTDNWPVIQLISGSDYVNSNNASESYNATKGTYTYDFELSDDQIEKLKSGVYFQGSINSGELVLKKVTVDVDDSGSGGSSSGGDSGSTTTYGDPVTIEYDEYGQVLASAFDGYSDDAKIEFTYEISGSSSYSGWGVGAIKSLDESVKYCDISADGIDGTKTISFTLGDIKSLLAAGPDQYNRYGVVFSMWTTGSSNDCIGTRKSLTISEVSSSSDTEDLEQGLWSDNLHLEAEDSDGYVSVSGSGYRTDALTDCTAIQMEENDDLLTFRFNIPSDGKYKVYVRAQGNGSAKLANLKIGSSTTAIFEAPESIAKVEVGRFNLGAGQTTITISPNWTYYWIDYVELEEDNTSTFFNVATAPVNTNATDEAKHLYTFLYNNFGTKTISGVMTGDLETSSNSGSYVSTLAAQQDVATVVSKSGKTPELVGFDFMNATGSGYDNDASYTNTALTLATELWNSGGIPAFTWHWRDPSRTTDSFYKNNGFDFTTAMNADGSWNTSSEIYGKMKADIDKVADYFLELQTAKIACIFRPLHEASYGGFWWGAQGAANYVKLYQLIYNEMVNVKGVNNVLWDWNNYYYASTDWCPGSTYYDIASTDIYNDANDYESNYIAFQKMQEQSGAVKLLALAECGPIPDIDYQANDDAMWSYWMAWYDSWNGGYVSRTSNDEWKKDMEDNRIITLGDVTNLGTNIVITDGTAFTQENDILAASASYTRSCSYEWGTLCLPFAYTSNDEVQYYSINSITTSTIVVSPVTNVAAGQPVLFRILSAADANGKYQLKVSATNVTVKNASYGRSDTEISNVPFYGTYTDVTIQNSNDTYMYYIANNKFWYAKRQATIPAYRAWFTVDTASSKAKSLAIKLFYDSSDEISTEISWLHDNEANDSQIIYNLQGQRLSAVQKGINIINGKKFLVK